jgi:hypothetical protein
MVKKMVFIGFICLLSLCSYSQTHIIVKGIILDQKTNQAIPYASISIYGLSIGVVSNESGEFLFKIPVTLSDKNLCVSSLGYNTYTKPLSSFLVDSYNIIKLELKAYTIEEVRIAGKRKNLSPSKIVELAIQKILDNYPTEPYVMQGYYREYVKQGSKKYLNLLESAIVIKDRGFKTSGLPYRAYLLQMRYNKDYETDKDFQTKYSNDKRIEKNYNIKFMPEHVMPVLGGNELSILLAHDAIRRYNERTYSYVYQLNKDFEKNHYFTLDSISYQEDSPIYCISFEYNDNVLYNKNQSVVNSNMRGRIFIQSNSYAIERLEYVSYSIKENGTKNFEIIADYKKRNGKMYLNYLSFSNFFKQAISTKNAQYEIPIEKEPLEIQDIRIEDDCMYISFNKKINRLTVYNRKNYEFNGFVTHSSNNSEKQDTLYLSKHPDRVLLSNNVLSISVANLKYLLDDDGSDVMSTSTKNLGDKFIINSKLKASIEGNTINCRNMTLTLKGVEDMYGNKVNSLCILDMFQFREFFVNEILDNSYSAPTGAKPINNETPIYFQVPQKIDSFWEKFNYPITAPLKDN